MPINKVREPAPRGRGNPPDENPRFLPSLAEAWFAKYAEDGNTERATANGSLIRGSDAGSCGRSLSYSIRQRNGEDIAPSNPTTVADSWRFGLGQMVHEALEIPLKRAFPDAEIEVVGVFEQPNLSLHADAVITDSGKRTLLELKSINGWGYKQAVLQGGGGAEGPRLSAVLQGAMAGTALNCDELVIGYLSLELLSPSVAGKAGMDDLGRFCAEWSYPREVFEPMGREELARLGTVLDQTLAGENVPRHIPGFGDGMLVTNPMTGLWVVMDGEFITNSGNAWSCQYCKWQDCCAADLKAGR